MKLFAPTGAKEKPLKNSNEDCRVRCSLLTGVSVAAGVFATTRAREYDYSLLYAG